jgi:hypothetical protein
MGENRAREFARPSQRTLPLWPGITWGNDSRCSCSWAFREGKMQLKAQNAGCVVHIGAYRARGGS